MKKVFVLLLFLFSFQVTYAQLHYKVKEALSKLLVKKVNDLRRELGKKELKRDPDLVKSAQLHSKYMVKRNSLNHNQIGTKFPKPKDRILHFNKSFVTFGENVLYSKPARLPLNDKALKKLALDMFRAWKSSPGHYANMISDSFTYGDFGFSYHPKSKRIFATHVFGKKGYIIPNQLSENAFSIIQKDHSCSELLSNISNSVVNVGNKITIENDELFLKHHNLETIKKILENEDDGIAIDLITRDQLLCEEENKLDASEIYDGIMLKPLYRDQIFSRNIAKNKNRLVVSLGKIPKHLLSKSVKPNAIIIKKGRKCGYSQPANIPSSRYNLRPIPPVLHRPPVLLKTSGVNTINAIRFNFKTGQTIPVKNLTIDFKITKLHSVEIKSFTSVDGNASSNEKLHKNRASYIHDFLTNTLNTESIPITIHAKENWELCYYQLELLGLENTFKDKEEIREFAKKTHSEEWEYALQLQRQSKAILYQYGTWTKSHPNHLNYNLTDALLNNNYALANRVLAEMYDLNNKQLFLNEEFIVNKLFNKKEVVQNVAALLLKNIDNYDLDNIVFFVRNWLQQPELLSEAAQKNLLNLYTITSRKLLRYWDNSSEDFSKVLHPKKVEPLFNNYKSEDIVNPLFLNFHMTIIEYYAQINYSPKISESFYFITDYFRDNSLNIQDEIDLTLFFNKWSMYHLTKETLLYRYNNKTLNEEACFVLLKTYVADYSDSDPEITFNLNKQAIKFNPQRWCYWINDDFQNLRNEGIKNLYCNTCKNLN